MKTIHIATLALVGVFLWPVPATGIDPLDTANTYDYIILTHHSLLPQAQILETHRSQHLRTCIVTTSQVETAFSGATLADKIRDFIVYAYEQWRIAPTYILFLGDANTTDPSHDLVPTKARVPEFYPPTTHYPSYADETFFVGPTRSGDRRPIMHHGRIPARTQAQAQIAVEKIIYYDGIAVEHPWLSRVLMTVGDCTSPTPCLQRNVVFKVYNDQLRESQLAHWSPQDLQTIYSSEHNFLNSGASVLRTAWNGGIGFVNALGNTSQDYLVFVASYRLPPFPPPTFTASLSANRVLPVVFGSTCVLNMFHLDNELCIGEDMLLEHKYKGAIAVVSASHKQDIFEAYAMNEIFVHELFHKGVRNVGRLLSTAKADLLGGQNGVPELINQYVLLGDPATDIKLHPLPVLPYFRSGMEIQDPPIVQQDVVVADGGIFRPRLRLCHAVELGGETVDVLESERALTAHFWDFGSPASRVEWKIQDLSLQVEQNMVLSFWVNVAQSPGDAGRIVIDGNTTWGRIRDNPNIVDQHGVRLKAVMRTPPTPGWQLVYADLSALAGSVITDLRVEYESGDESEIGNMNAYFDDIRIERHTGGSGLILSHKILNYSFEEDVNRDGTPDYWTDLHSMTGTSSTLRCSEYVVDGKYSLVVFNEHCEPGQGAQQVIFVNSYDDLEELGYSFHHRAMEATSFQFRIVDALTEAVYVNREIQAGFDWQSASGSFSHAVNGYGRLLVQFIPNECLQPIWIDAVEVSGEVHYPGAVDMVSHEPGATGQVITSVWPNPGTGGDRFEVGFRLTEPALVALEVFDISGRLVGSSKGRMLEAGKQRIGWSAGDGPAAIAAGRYWIRLLVDGDPVPGAVPITVVR